MQFLSPLFLVAMAIAGLPILIHLLVSQRRRRFQFSTLRFLRKAELESQGRIRLREWLLLALRCLALLLLVLAMAQPVARFSLPGLTAPPVIVIVLDDSYSMAFRDEGGTRFQHAKRAAEVVLKRFNSAPIALVAASKSGQPLELPTEDHERIRTALLELSVSLAPVDIGAAIRTAEELLLRSGGTTKQLYVFTDMQRSQFSAWKLPALADIQAFIVNVRTTDASSNVAITRVQANAIREPSSPRTVRVDARQFSGEPIPAELVCSVEGKAIGGPLIASLSDETGGARRFILPPIGKGLHRGLVRLSGDKLSIDNDFHFTLLEVYPIQVLLVEDAPNSALFIREALVSMRDEQGRQLVEVRSVSQSALRPAHIVDTDVVVLVQPVLLEAEVIRVIREAAWGGKGVVVFAGARNASDLGGLWGGSLQAEWAQVPRGSWRIGDVDKEHLVAGGLSESNLQDVQFYGRLVLPREDNMVASFSDGVPLLIERTVGKGIVMLFGSGADGRSNSFPRLAVFVPFVYRLVAYAAIGQQVRPRSRLSVDVAESFGFHDSDLSLFTAAEELFIVEQAGWKFVRGRVLLTDAARDQSPSSDLRLFVLILVAGTLLAESALIARVCLGFGRSNLPED